MNSLHFAIAQASESRLEWTNTIAERSYLSDSEIMKINNFKQRRKDLIKGLRDTQVILHKIHLEVNTSALLGSGLQNYSADGIR